MKAKTIKAVIRKKIDEWLATIEDKEVREKAATGTIVTGGCIASMLLREKVNDFDIYFKDKATATAVADYYVKRFQPQKRRGIPCKIHVDGAGDRVRIIIKSAGVASEDGTEKEYQYFESRPDGEASEYISEIMRDPGDIADTQEATQGAALDVVDDGKPRYRPVFMSTNAITLSHRIQIVLRFYGMPDEIHENYDYVHCTSYWTSWDEDLVLKPGALEALLTRELRYVGSKYPICSLIRMRKFINRGWTINAGQVLKMAMQVSQLNLSDPAVLEDQLTGVDVAYFMEVLAKVKESDPEKVSSAYLIEIIDRMF